MCLSPLDPNMFGMHGGMAYAHFLAGRYDLASSCAEKATRDNPAFLLAICISAASNALAGQLEAFGVRHVFGTCGHTNIALLDALSRSSITVPPSGLDLAVTSPSWARARRRAM